VLLLAGDLTDDISLLQRCLSTLSARFRKVLFVPGNHDLWVLRDPHTKDSLEKFNQVSQAAESCGASMSPFKDGAITVVPLLGWYDYSFGSPSDEFKSMWMDFYACRWPSGFGVRQIAAHFAAINDRHAVAVDATVITFSHFLPRIDVMPAFIPTSKRQLYPILGSTIIERQLRALKSCLHVYGHSHVNRRVTLEGVSYINNAFGYPQEAHIAAKELLCVYEQ
jgi:hypothetical protein